jgi:hypothetical protein
MEAKLMSFKAQKKKTPLLITARRQHVNVTQKGGKGDVTLE